MRPSPRPALPRAPARAVVFGAAFALLAACSGPGSSVPPSAAASSHPTGTVRLYTSVTQDTVDAVLAAYAKVAPDVSVEVFRAPTGQLDARIATELRQGRIGGDVLWATDPLSTEAWAARGVLRTWTPTAAASVPARYHTDTFWGTRILNMILVAHDGVTPVPVDWPDLANPAFRGKVAIPDPGFAGSAFGALGYLASAHGAGMDLYRTVQANGGVQVQSIADVLTGVAEGQYAVGMTLDKSARDAIAKGSPVRLIWPASGAIAIYSPIALFRDAANATAAASFANFVLTPAGQAAIAGTGWQPIRADVPGGPPIDGAQVSPDWNAVFGQEDTLLKAYRAIFGG